MFPLEKNIFPSCVQRGFTVVYHSQKMTQLKGKKVGFNSRCVFPRCFFPKIHVSGPSVISPLRTKNDFPSPRPHQVFMPQPPANGKEAEAPFLELGSRSKAEIATKLA